MLCEHCRRLSLVFFVRSCECPSGQVDIALVMCAGMHNIRPAPHLVQQAGCLLQMMPFAACPTGSPVQSARRLLSHTRAGRHLSLRCERACASTQVRTHGAARHAGAAARRAGAAGAAARAAARRRAARRARAAAAAAAASAARSGGRAATAAPSASAATAARSAAGAARTAARPARAASAARRADRAALRSAAGAAQAQPRAHAARPRPRAAQPGAPPGAQQAQRGV